MGSSEQSKDNMDQTELTELKNTIEDKVREYQKMMVDLEIEKRENINLVKSSEDRAARLKVMAEMMILELSEEERILRHYEILEKRFNILNIRYNSMSRSFLGRLTIWSWNVYNKIKYNKEPTRWKHQ
jgi:ectoine hydroxylase-related dioxygenase (phytanoyl-CoA dioxygenase family)